MRKTIYSLLSTSLLVTSLIGCSSQSIQPTIETKATDFDYEVNPENFEVTVTADGKQEVVSQSLEKRKVSNLIEKEKSISWTYPKEKIEVEISKETNYLDIEIRSTKNENEFTWPVVAADNYMLPIGEGKFIPNDDPYWKKHLNNNEMNAIESLTMGFFAANHEKYSVMYVMDDMYNSSIKFDTENDITFAYNHKYTSINKDKKYGFRIYITEKNPVDVAKIYRNYKIEKGEFKTLAEKAKENKNIEKLYGAVHMYLWDTTVVSEDDIKWDIFRNQTSSKTMEWIKDLLNSEVEDGQETVKAINDIAQQDYVDNYQKGVISQGISKALVSPNFYNEQAFPKKDKTIEKFLQKGIDSLNEVEVIELNKRSLYANLDVVFTPVDDWANNRTLDLVKNMKKAGINEAWIGLDNWSQGFIKPEMVEAANKYGYLIGPYDSYHSIHEPGKEKWHTATFKDKSLFENATITDKEGNRESGFQNVGRKLNPTLSLPSVQERVSSILKTGVAFNSWFIDCDATGEIYDDYTHRHVTTQKEDLQARLDRMAYIRDAENMVIGSEGGNDFASSTIAFAHGIELPSFSWMDEDMKFNKESEYYIGRYYASKGGAPEKVTKQIPVKKEYKKIFLDNTYNIPLFKLVYNDSVITTYHWDWSTFKIKDEVSNRMLYEILYNVPPLYHVDKFEWEKYEKEMVQHSKVWSNFSKKAINKEMTNFKTLTSDRLVQMTQYGEDLKVVANFSNDLFEYNGDKLEAGSLIIYSGNSKEVYKPGK